MSQLEIQSALVKRLATVSGIPDIYYRGVSEEPSRGTDFVAPFVEVVDAIPLHIDGKQQNDGFFIVECYISVGRGEGPLLSIMDSIKDHFKAQRILVEGDTEVFIGATTVDVQAAVGSTIDVKSWLKGLVRIKYTSIEK